MKKWTYCLFIFSATETCQGHNRDTPMEETSLNFVSLFGTFLEGGFDKTNEQRTPLTLLGNIEDIFSVGKSIAHRILNRHKQAEAIMPQGKSKL